jgi:hypothetical protein
MPENQPQRIEGQPVPEAKILNPTVSSTEINFETAPPVLRTHAQGYDRPDWHREMLGL